MEEVVGSIPTRSTNSYHNGINNLKTRKSYWTSFEHEWHRVRQIDIAGVKSSR